MASLFKRSNGNYYICYEEDGKRKWKSTGQTHKSDALKELIQFETHLKTYRSKITLKQFKQDLLIHAKTSFAPKTVEMYSAALDHLQAIVGDKFISSISPKDAAAIISLGLLGLTGLGLFFPQPRRERTKRNKNMRIGLIRMSSYACRAV